MSGDRAIEDTETAAVIYDMCTTVLRDIVIPGVRLLYKNGFRIGEFRAPRFDRPVESGYLSLPAVGRLPAELANTWGSARSIGPRFSARPRASPAG